MISLRRGAFGALTLSVLLGAFAAPSVRAQDVPAQVAVAPDVQTRTFTLRNVKASLVAFWLDPAHHPMPIEVQYGRVWSETGALKSQEFPSPLRGSALDSSQAPPLSGNANGPRDLKLPSGIARIVVIDPQNSILVSGTSDALSALEKLLPRLDVPLVQYEVEAHFYQLDRATLPELGLKFEPMQGETADNFGSSTGLPLDSEERFRKLVEANRAQLLTAPRVTLLDGMGAELKQTTSTVAAWNETPSLPRPVDAPANVQTPQRIALIRTSIGIRTSVTRVEDGLIALAIEPRFGTRILSIQATVREEQPFAIQMSASTDARQIIVVVTPRRVQRVGEDTQRTP